MKLRYYQANAIDAGCELLNGNTSIRNGIIVIPTGGGKSHVIAGVADEQNDAGLILQPSKEILEQNYQKLFKLGRRDLGIYSASLGSKAIKNITLATIGSIYNKPDDFRHFKYVAVDECDLVNHLGGMYKEFFTAINRPVLGLTASPWRLQPGKKIGQMRVRGGRMIDKFSGSNNQIITRIKGRFFEDLIHLTQLPELYEQKFLTPLKYVEGVMPEQLKLTLNSSGNDYTDATYKRISRNVINDMAKAIQRTPAKHHLGFVKRIEDAQEVADKLNALGIPATIVTGESKDRDQILTDFKSGKLKAVINVGVLTVGFDFPDLDHIIVGRPINSLRLYYQILGRGIRLAPGKEYCTLTDLCGSVDRFGHIENWIIQDNNGDKAYRLYNGDRPLTSIDMKSGMDLEQITSNSCGNQTEIHFGKHKGTKIADAPTEYLDWIVGNFSPGPFRNLAIDEIARRAIS